METKKRLAGALLDTVAVMSGTTAGSMENIRVTRAQKGDLIDIKEDKHAGLASCYKGKKRDRELRDTQEKDSVTVKITSNYILYHRIRKYVLMTNIFIEVYNMMNNLLDTMTLRFIDWNPLRLRSFLSLLCEAQMLAPQGANPYYRL